jgi:antitoxin (DNA-binding transcriptional repressor) of toxin-antitoxin stability system
MVVTATELAKNSDKILDRVVRGGEVMDVTRDGKTVAEIRPKVGVSRAKLLELLSGRGFTPADSQELREAMDSISEIIGYAGRD